MDALSLPLAWAGGALGLKFGTTLLCAVRRQDCPWAVPGKAPEQSQFGAPDFLPGKMRLRAGRAPGTDPQGWVCLGEIALSNLKGLKQLLLTC